MCKCVHGDVNICLCVCMYVCVYVYMCVGCIHVCVGCMHVCEGVLGYVRGCIHVMPPWLSHTSIPPPPSLQ